jgi:iron complex outermembrane recepter protein
VVYSYFSGGTSWENLPVGIQDVERIEVVRGPAAALYGPNAVNGVINIITSHAKNEGLNSFANVSISNMKDKTLNASVGYNWKDKTKITFSGNYSDRYRYDKTYYDWATNRYVDQDSLNLAMPLMRDTVLRTYWDPKSFRDTLNSYFNEERSYKNSSINLFVNHQFSHNSTLDFSIGGQHAISQKPGPMNMMTPLSENESNTGYFDMRLKVYNLFVQLDIIGGEEISNFAYNSNHFAIVHQSVEYDWQILKNLSFRPGVDFRYIEYFSPIINKTPFNFAKMNYDTIMDAREVSTNSIYFLTEWKPINGLRFIGGFRMDTFNLDHTAAINYELAATYRINKNNLVRFTNSKASRAPFVFDTYLNSKNEYDGYIQVNKDLYYTVPTEQRFVSQKGLKYPTNNTFELGLRSKLFSNTEIDVEVFTSKLNHLLATINRDNVDFTASLNAEYGLDTLVEGKINTTMDVENDNMSARQTGVSMTANIKLNSKANLSLFGTYQYTKLSRDSYYNQIFTETDTIYDPKSNTIRFISTLKSNFSGWNISSTPDFYGGFALNYKLLDNVNVNLNGYISTRQIFYNDLCLLEDRNVEMPVSAWMNLNYKIAWQPADKITLYTSAFNLLGKHREFGGTDKIGRSFLIGFQYGF